MFWFKPSWTRTATESLRMEPDLQNLKPLRVLLPTVRLKKLSGRKKPRPRLRLRLRPRPRLRLRLRLRPRSRS